MKIRMFSALIAILLCGSASAWGPAASKFICNEAVKYVWGVNATADCLPPSDPYVMQKVCDSTYNVLGSDYESRCRSALAAGSVVHPALISYLVYNDSENHYDYARCPLSSSAKNWICGDSSVHPASDIAREWFREAESASDECTRVYLFCVGGSYYADSESKLHQMRYIIGDCVQNIEGSIDRSIENGLSNWGSNQLCRFSNGVKGDMNAYYEERIGESSSTLNMIIANLTAEGYRLNSLPYKAGGEVIVLANTIDYANAIDFMAYLKANGLKAAHVSAIDFGTLKYGRRVIILGGHNAPEGIGDAAKMVLTDAQEQTIMAPGESIMSVKADIWAANQTVIIIAGNEAQDTSSALAANRENILSEIQKH
jgi:hypothetical protein